MSFSHNTNHFTLRIEISIIIKDFLLYEGIPKDITSQYSNIYHVTVNTVNKHCKIILLSPMCATYHLPRLFRKLYTHSMCMLDNETHERKREREEHKRGLLLYTFTQSQPQRWSFIKHGHLKIKPSFTRTAF